MTRFTCLVKSIVETVFKLVRQHFLQTSRRSRFFQCAHERMLVIACVGRHLRHLSFSDLICEDPADALAASVDLEHDARRARAVESEELFQYVDDKLHGSVVVIEQNHLVEGGLFDLRSGFFDRGRLMQSERMLAHFQKLVYRFVEGEAPR